MDFAVLKDSVYVPTVAKTEAGFYQAIEPVAVVKLSDSQGLTKVLKAMLLKGNPIIPTPKPAGRATSPILKYSPIKSLPKFDKEAAYWKIYEKGGVTETGPLEKTGSDGRMIRRGCGNCHREVLLTTLLVRWLTRSNVPPVECGRLSDGGGCVYGNVERLHFSRDAGRVDSHLCPISEIRSIRSAKIRQHLRVQAMQRSLKIGEPYRAIGKKIKLALNNEPKKSSDHPVTVRSNCSLSLCFQQSILPPGGLCSEDTSAEGHTKMTRVLPGGVESYKCFGILVDGWGRGSLFRSATHLRVRCTTRRQSSKNPGLFGAKACQGK